MADCNATGQLMRVVVPRSHLTVGVFCASTLTCIHALDFAFDFGCFVDWCSGSAAPLLHIHCPLICQRGGSDLLSSTCCQWLVVLVGQNNILTASVRLSPLDTRDSTQLLLAQIDCGST